MVIKEKFDGSGREIFLAPRGPLKSPETSDKTGVMILRNEQFRLYPWGCRLNRVEMMEQTSSAKPAKFSTIPPQNKPIPKESGRLPPNNTKKIVPMLVFNPTIIAILPAIASLETFTYQ